QLRHRHALVLGKDAVNDAAGLELAQARVQFVPGLGRAAGVELLDDMRDAVQHQHHHAFELGWQNRLHCDLRRPGRNPRAATGVSGTQLLTRTLRGVNPTKTLGSPSAPLVTTTMTSVELPLSLPPSPRPSRPSALGFWTSDFILHPSS